MFAQGIGNTSTDLGCKSLRACQPKSEWWWKCHNELAHRNQRKKSIGQVNSSFRHAACIAGWIQFPSLALSQRLNIQLRPSISPNRFSPMKSARPLSVCVFPTGKTSWRWCKRASLFDVELSNAQGACEGGFVLKSYYHRNSTPYFFSVILSRRIYLSILIFFKYSVR